MQPLKYIAKLSLKCQLLVTCISVGNLRVPNSSVFAELNRWVGLSMSLGGFKNNNKKGHDDNGWMFLSNVHIRSPSSSWVAVVVAAAGPCQAYLILSSNRHKPMQNRNYTHFY